MQPLIYYLSARLEYPKNGDADNDGILNYLDAFPEDATKVDADHDLVADSEDTTANGTTPFLQDWQIINIWTKLFILITSSNRKINFMK